MKIVVSLGTNALLQRDQKMTADNQKASVRKAAEALAALAREQHFAKRPSDRTSMTQWK
ncbi:hypothetical protein [Shimia sp. Alg240-R146]|uniref:hypothetical protein n=1 Tax=Shimia sp. Alg240-R146 TaxID=2993449 RepID=UPI0022E5EB05|nr:hypothetical protein [Shimia sp. Alg240-R146]